MSYVDALEAAGARVHAYEEFGSYQGDWYAYVTYQGVTGFVRGAFGSCSGCDAFQAEFDYASDHCEKHRYGWGADAGSDECADCRAAARDYTQKLIEFGEGYLDYVHSPAEALARASEHAEWDMEASSMIAWIREVSGYVESEEDEEDADIANSLQRLGLLN